MTDSARSAGETDRDFTGWINFMFMLTMVSGVFFLGLGSIGGAGDDVYYSWAIFVAFFGAIAWLSERSTDDGKES